jgi:serine phosphatase RsbU (regulator of sigma subunit)
MFNEPSLTQRGSWRLTAVLHVTIATWISNAAAVLSGPWGAVTRRAQQSGYSRTAVYTHAQRVVQAVTSEQAGGISYDALWQENERLKAALYQHSCHEVQSSCNALSVKELQQRSAIGLLSQQRMKSISAT